MSATILAKATVVLFFGINSGVTALAGYIANDADTDNSSKTAEAADDQGSTVAVAFFDQMIDIKFNALLKSGGAFPTPGTVVVVGSGPGVKFAVMRATKKEKNNGFTFLTLDLKRWSDNLIPN